MDSEPGCCWRCGEPAHGSCPRCELALYCSTTCLQDDRSAHLSECEEAGTAELPCANCGRQSRHLSRCARCHLAAYCSGECGELHSRLHLPACLAGRDAVLRLANRLTHAPEPFRLPSYFGEGVHALNLLKNTDQTGEEPCQLLQLSAQLPHLLRTAADVSDSRRPLLATLASDSGHQLARAYLLLYLVARGAGPAATVQVMYSLRLTPEHARLLQAALEQLVTATYSQLLQLVPWVRLGRAALSLWQEVWRAWLHAMQDAGCLARLERGRDAAMAEPETARRLERYLATLPERQQRSAREFLLGHGTLMGDRQRRAAADCANVTLLALSPREQRHREAFCDLRLGSNPPAWLETAGRADTVFTPPSVPAGALADWDRAEVARAFGADVDPADGCRRLAEDCTEAVEARAAAGRLSVRFVQFNSLTELDEQLADLRFERVFTAGATDRLGLFDVLEMAEILLAPVPYALIVSSHSRWAELSAPAGTALSALRCGGSMAWDRQMDTEKFRLQTYLQGERLAYAARARHKDVLDAHLRVPTVPEVTSFGTLLMTNFSQQLQDAVPHKFRPERRAVSNGDEAVRFLEWRRDPEGVRKRLAKQRGPTEAAAAAAAATVGDAPQPRPHRGPGLYERHLQNPALESNAAPVRGDIRRRTGLGRRLDRSADASSDPRMDQRSGVRADHLLHPDAQNVPDHRPGRTQSARRPRRSTSAPLARAGSLPAAQRRRQESSGFQPAPEVPLYENPAAARAAARKAEREAIAQQTAAEEATSLATLHDVPERPRSEPGRSQRRVSRRRTIETGPVTQPVPPSQQEPFRRTASLRVSKKHVPVDRLRAPLVSEEENTLRAERSPANRLPATLPRSLESRFPSLRSPLIASDSPYANSPSAEDIYAVPDDVQRVARREQVYAVPRDILRTAPRHQQSSFGRSGSPQFALSPSGTPYALYRGHNRPTSPGTDSLSSQNDSPLTASHYSALQTPEGRRRLTNIFSFPPARPERSIGTNSVQSISQETSAPPDLPAKLSGKARLMRTEQPPSPGASLSLRRQPDEARRARQTERGFSNTSLTLPRQASENMQNPQPGRAMTLPKQSSEPSYSLRADWRSRTYEAPVPLPRKSADTRQQSEYDDYAVPQPRPRQMLKTSQRPQSVSGSEDTLTSSQASNGDTIGGSVPGNATSVEPHEPEASPADIDKVIQWREAKSIGDWLRKDRTRQSEFDRRAQSAGDGPRWTRSELAPLPPSSSPQTRPGRITPTASSSTSAAEKRRAFLRGRETTEERLVRSLENAESAWWTTRQSSTDNERSSHSMPSPPHDLTRGADKNPGPEFLQSGGTPPSKDIALLSTKDLPHNDDEPQTIAQLGLRDTVAGWILEQCLQEVLNEESETLRSQLIRWLKQKIAEELQYAQKALRDAKAASTEASTVESPTGTDTTPVPEKTVSETTSLKDRNTRIPASRSPDVAAKETQTTSMERRHTSSKGDDVGADHLSVPKSPEATAPIPHHPQFSPFDINSEESGKLGSPRFPVVDTPVPKSIARDNFFADMFQLQSSATGERLVTLRLDATTQVPPSPGENNPAKTPLFSSSVIIPSPEKGLSVPQRIVIDVVPEPTTVQPPAIRVPLRPAPDTEVKARARPKTPPVEPVDDLSGKHVTEDKQNKDSISAMSDASVHAPPASTVRATSTISPPADKLPNSDYFPVREKGDVGKLASPRVKPLSLLNPYNTGRATAAPSGYFHRSPVEEPYPALGDDLSSRRERLEARAAARESMSPSTDQSSLPFSSPEQPEPPSSPPNFKASDFIDEAPRSNTASEEESEKESELDAVEQLKGDNVEGEERVPITYRSSIHIPMEKTQDDSGDPQLEEILIKFPLVTLDSGEPQVGRLDVTTASPRRETETKPTKQAAEPTPSSPADVAIEPTEEHGEQFPNNREEIILSKPEPGVEQKPAKTANVTMNPNAGKSLTSQKKGEDTPAQSLPMVDAYISADDDSTPPPLPLSPPPKSSAQLFVVANDEVIEVQDNAAATEPRRMEAETSATTKEESNVATKVDSTVPIETEVMAAQANELDVNIDAPMIKTSTATKNITKKTMTSATEEGDNTTAAGRGPEEEQSDVAARKHQETVGVCSAEVAMTSTEEASEDKEAVRRHSLDKQRERLRNLRRRRSRKMSLDKEYHDMTRKLTEANAGLASQHDPGSGDGENLSTQRDVGLKGGVATNNAGGSIPVSRSVNGSCERASSTSDLKVREADKRHPGSLAKNRRKSRPLSMDAEYYAMKSKLQVHNGHPDHAGEHNRTDDDQQGTMGCIGGDSQTSASSEHKTDPVPILTSGQTSPGSGPITAPVPATGSSGTASTTGGHSSAKAARRRSSRRLTMDKEFFDMRAQLALHHDDHRCSVPGKPLSASPATGFEPEDPPSPPPSPISGPPPSVLQPFRGNRRLSIEDEFFAIRAAHMARHPFQSEGEERSPPCSPKVQSRSSTVQEQDVKPKASLELRASADRSPASLPSGQVKSAASGSKQEKKPPTPVILQEPAPAPQKVIETTAAQSKLPQSVPAGAGKPPSHTKKPLTTRSPISQKPSSSVNPTTASQAITTPVAADRGSIRPLPLDPDLLASRAQLERPPAGPVPQFPPTSPATPPSSPTSVLSRTGRPGSIRRRVQELERSAVEAEAPLSPSAPAPFDRASRAGSVREKIRRMEQLQRGQEAAEAERSPVPLRRHSTHSPFTRLGSGGGGGVSSLTVRLQPSPPAAAQPGPQSPSGPTPPRAAPRSRPRHRNSLPSAGLGSRSPGFSETPNRKAADEFRISEQTSETQEGLSATPEPSGLEREARSPTIEVPQSRSTNPPTPAAECLPKKTPSPPDLVAWPWTTEDDAAEARQIKQAEPKSSDVDTTQSSPEQRRASAQSLDSVPSAYETAHESSFSPLTSAGESWQAEAEADVKAAVPEAAAAARGRTIADRLESSSGTEIDAQDDDVFVDGTGRSPAVTAL